MSMKAIVKSVLSGDTLILRGRPGPQGQPPKERILHLADLSAPRVGTSTRDDEDWAFESREFLRQLSVGKEISFTSVHSLPTNDDILRDLGNGEVGGIDLSTEVLKNGWAKLKDLKRESSEDDLRKKDLENEARTAGKGIWNSHGPKACSVHHLMPTEPQVFVSEWKGKSLDGLVEQVRDGTTLRVRLFMPDGDHQMVNISLAGVKSPRASTRQGESSESFGEEAKSFTEARLLQRHVKVEILSLPNVVATPFQSTSTSSAPPPASVFIGNVLHPAGNVAEHLVANGLARIVEWHAGMLANAGGMERLRAAERSAKERRIHLFAHQPSSTANGHGDRAALNGPTKVFEATVVRVWSGDQVSVVGKDESQERRLYFSSTRAPKHSDPRQAAYAQEAREFIRKKLIGKTVKVRIDFVRPREGEIDERECASIRYGGQNANIAEQLIEKGFASVVRHKRDDEDRSPDYDKLINAEQTALTALRGIHSGKDVPPPKQPLNLSESGTRAQTFLNTFKRAGKIPAVVEFVSAGSRFKLYLPKDNQSLTLVLAGIRAPKSARNATEKSEPYGAEALEFSTRRYMQRDVEFEVESIDKSGGFIGVLYINKTENAALSLLKEGLATVHDYSAEELSWARQLREAEEEAKKSKRNIWRDYDEEAVKSAEANAKEGEEGALKSEYLDVIVSDIRSKDGFSFSVQILNTEGIASLEKLMREFSIHYRSVAASPGFIPKGGELVSAKFSDGAWYRAKIRRCSAVKKEAEVVFIDYGNQDTVPFSNIRPLDAKFRTLAGQAHEARLSFVKLVPAESEYYSEAIERFRSMCEGRKLIANVDYKEGGLLHLRLIDPTKPGSEEDALGSVNADLVAEGLASVDRKGCGRYIEGYPLISVKLKESVLEAKKSRAGMFEFGDVEEDE